MVRWSTTNTAPGGGFSYKNVPQTKAQIAAYEAKTGIKYGGKVMYVGGKKLPYNRDAVKYYERAGVNVKTGRNYVQDANNPNAQQKQWSGKTMTVHGQRLPYNAAAVSHYNKAGLKVKVDNRGGSVSNVQWKGTSSSRGGFGKVGSRPTSAPSKVIRPSRSIKRRMPTKVRIVKNPGRRNSPTRTVHRYPGRNIRLPSRPTKA